MVVVPALVLELVLWLVVLVLVVLVLVRVLMLVLLVLVQLRLRLRVLQILMRWRCWRRGSRWGLLCVHGQNLNLADCIVKPLYGAHNLFSTDRRGNELVVTAKTRFSSAGRRSTSPTYCPHSLRCPTSWRCLRR